MNDGKTILRLQGTQGIQHLIKVQRQLYEHAKALRLVSAMACFAVPIIITVCQIRFPGCIPEEICFGRGVIFYVACLITSKLSERRTRAAAAIQQSIDGQLYGICFPFIQIDDDLAARASLTISKQQDQLDEHVVWYSETIGDLDPSRAVYECQCENMGWSKNLLRRWVVFLLIGTILFLVAIICCIAMGHTNIATLSFVLSPIQWAVDATFIIHQALRLIDQFEVLGTRNSEQAPAENKVRDLQEIIYTLRQTVLIPAWIYKLFYKREEALSAERILINGELNQ